MPEIANRHADARFTALRLGIRGMQHARPKHVELEFANTALHAEQQPVVRSAWIVHAIKVDDPRLNETTQFEQMVPVALLRARRDESRQRTAPTSPALSNATRRSKPGRATVPLADRPRSSSIDDLDIAKPTALCLCHQLVQATLALEVRLDLVLCRLTNVSYRLALEKGRRQTIGGCHRHAPSRWLRRRLGSAGLQDTGLPLRAAPHSFPEARRCRTRCSSGAASPPAIVVVLEHPLAADPLRFSRTMVKPSGEFARMRRSTSSRCRAHKTQRIP